MFALVESCVEMGLSQRAFCGKHGISYSKFKYWYKRYCQDKDSVSSSVGSEQGKFIELQSGAPDLNELRLDFPNGVVLKMSSPADFSSLRSLIKLF